MKRRAKKRTSEKKRTREGTPANGRPPAIREWTQAELHVGDQLVVRQARSGRKGRVAEERPPAIREWTEAELHAEDQFVIRQAAWKRKQPYEKVDSGDADDNSLLLQGPSEDGERLPIAGPESPAPQIGIHSQAGRAMTGRMSPESGSSFDGINLELIRHLPVGFALIWPVDRSDVRTWRIAVANKIAREVLGKSLVDFLLTRVAKSFPFHQEMEEVYKSILQRKDPRDLHWQICEVGGVRRTYSVTGFAVPPKYLGLLMQDVTTDRHIRNVLIEHKARYEEISHAIATFLWKGDPATLQTKWVSREAESVLGYWPEHWYKIPNFWLDQIDPQDRETVERTIREEAGAKGARFDYRMKAADGQTMWLHAVIHVSEAEPGQSELTGVMVDITARKRAEEAAHELSRKLLRSQDEERRHVARELHDSLGQYLSVLGMNVGTLSRTVPGLSEQQEAIFAETTDLLETCSRELRTLSYLMHPPMLDEVGLIPALEWYASGFSERSKIQVRVDSNGIAARLPRLVEMAFFRITQEALTNIYRHSRSKTAEIGLQGEDGGVTLKIGDSGGGLDVNILEGVGSGNGGAKGVGIRGMRERMGELGGTLAVASSKKGTMISAHIPRTASVFAKESQDEENARREAPVVNAR